MYINVYIYVYIYIYVHTPMLTTVGLYLLEMSESMEVRMWVSDILRV